MTPDVRPQDEGGDVAVAHAHHWRIDPPNGPWSAGVCLKDDCLKTRWFRNSPYRGNEYYQGSDSQTHHLLPPVVLRSLKRLEFEEWEAGWKAWVKTAAGGA